MSVVKRTEQGWAGHFICSRNRLFKRNTLIEYKDRKKYPTPDITANNIHETIVEQMIERIQKEEVDNG